MVVPEFETARLRFRAMADSDAEALFGIFSDPQTIRYWGTPDRTLEETRLRIERMHRHWEEHGFGDWALIHRGHGRFIGYCGLHYITGMSLVNLGYICHRDYWGQGLGTEAGLACVRYGFGTVEALEQIVGTTDPENLPSIRVLERCGMSYWKRVLRNGRERVVYSIRRSQWPG